MAAHALAAAIQILETTSAALSSTTKRPTTEFDRAVFQLHAQLLAMVTESLATLAAGTDMQFDASSASDPAAPSAARPATLATDEFVQFLEIQSRTQVKILEVEVRAGQELLQLHKSQFETERTEVRQ